MPAHYFTASGAGVERQAVQLHGVPLNGELVRTRLRASALAGATTAAIHFFTRISNEVSRPLGWIARPGAVDPATVDQLNLAFAKTGIALTASASATSDVSAPGQRTILQGELWVIVDVTVAAGAWTVIGSVDTVDIALM